MNTNTNTNMNIPEHYDEYLKLCRASYQAETELAVAVQQALKAEGCTAAAVEAGLRERLVIDKRAAEAQEAGVEVYVGEVAQAALGGSTTEGTRLPANAAAEYEAAQLPGLLQTIKAYPRSAIFAAGVLVELAGDQDALAARATGTDQDLADWRQTRNKLLEAVADTQGGAIRSLGEWLGLKVRAAEAALKLPAVTRRAQDLETEQAILRALAAVQSETAEQVATLHRRLHRQARQVPLARKLIADQRAAWEQEAAGLADGAPWPIGPLAAERRLAEHQQLPAPTLPPELLGQDHDGPELAKRLGRAAREQVAREVRSPSILEVVEQVEREEQRAARPAADWPRVVQSGLLRQVWDRGPYALAEEADPRVLLLRIGPADNPFDYPPEARVDDVEGLPSELVLLRLEAGLQPTDLAVYRAHQAAFAAERQRRHFGLLVPPTDDAGETRPAAPRPERPSPADDRPEPDANQRPSAQPLAATLVNAQGQPLNGQR